MNNNRDTFDFEPKLRSRESIHMMNLGIPEIPAPWEGFEPSPAISAQPRLRSAASIHMMNLGIPEIPAPWEQAGESGRIN